MGQTTLHIPKRYRDAGTVVVVVLGGGEKTLCARVKKRSAILFLL